MNLHELYDLYLRHPVICTDSRQVEPGSIFCAIKGEVFDGNHYAAQALDRGAAYAIVDNPQVAASKQMVLVNNVVETLQQLARHHRSNLKIPVVGITGSNGKTTTKELIAKVLEQKYRILFTSGNLNNHLGVPLTLLKLNQQHEIGIIEMGANHIGEIAFLCQLAQPTHGIITNIGKAHLEGFGGIEGVIKAKTELYEYLRSSNGIVFVNGCDELLMNKSAGIKRVIYGNVPKSLAKGTIKSVQPTLTIEWEANESVTLSETNLSGAYNLDNVLAAISIGVYFEVNTLDIHKAIESYVPKNNRSQLLKTGNNVLIMDAYNANPSSMQAALANFQQLQADRKGCILGDMFELGIYASEEHHKICDILSSLNLSEVILVGSEFYAFKDQYPFRFFATTTDARDWLSSMPLNGYTLLLKGSRKMQLEQLVSHL